MFVFGLLCLAAFSTLTDGQIPRHNRLRPWTSRSRPSRRFNPRYAQVRRVLPPVNRQGDPGNQSFMPESWRDLIGMNGNIHDVNDFINLLVTSEGRPVVDSDIFSPYETPDGKRVITGGGVLATSDECSPRNMSVRLPLDFSDGEVAYYPECTMVQRCGGCTPTPFLTCEPQYKEKIVLKVLRARYLYPGALSMRWEGFTSVEVERHLSCRAVCNLEPQDCRRAQRFNSYQCKCQCVRSERCVRGKMWDSDSCSCRCANERPCCAPPGGEDDRTCTSFFDHSFCECTLKVSIGVSPNASQEEIEEWLESYQQSTTRLPTPTIPSTSTTTTSTTTTVSTTTPSSDRCGRNRCPLYLEPSFENGRCICRYRGSRGFPGRH